MRAPLVRFHELFSGSVWQTKPSGNDQTRQIDYHWRAFSATAAAALEVMRPYLVVKAEAADIGLTFWRECSRPVGWNAKRETGRARAFTPEEAERRLELYW